LMQAEARRCMSSEDAPVSASSFCLEELDLTGNPLSSVLCAAAADVLRLLRTVRGRAREGPALHSTTSCPPASVAAEPPAARPEPPTAKPLGQQPLRVLRRALSEPWPGPGPLLPETPGRNAISEGEEELARGTSPHEHRSTREDFLLRRADDRRRFLHEAAALTEQGPPRPCREAPQSEIAATRGANDALSLVRQAAIEELRDGKLGNHDAHVVDACGSSPGVSSVGIGCGAFDSSSSVADTVPPRSSAGAQHPTSTQEAPLVTFPLSAGERSSEGNGRLVGSELKVHKLVRPCEEKVATMPQDGTEAPGRRACGTLTSSLDSDALAKAETLLAERLGVLHAAAVGVPGGLEGVGQRSAVLGWHGRSGAGGTAFSGIAFAEVRLDEMHREALGDLCASMVGQGFLDTEASNCGSSLMRSAFCPGT